MAQIACSSTPLCGGRYRTRLVAPNVCRPAQLIAHSLCAQLPARRGELREARTRVHARPRAPEPEPLTVHAEAKEDVPERTGWWSLASGMSKALALGCLAFALVFANCDAALAARSGGRVGGTSFSRAAASARSYGPRSGGMGSYRSSTVVAPSVGMGLPSVFVPVSPFGFGLGYGYGYSSFSTVLLLAMMAFVAFNVMQNLSGADDTDYDTPPVSLAKLQVGLLASARTLRRDLDRMASRADTSTPEGLHFLLQEIVLALLRNPSYCVYGASEAQRVRDPEEAERRFSAMSLSERSKFKQETLVNYGGVTSRAGSSSRGAPAGVDELVVVTVLVAAETKLKLPPISSLEDLRGALTMLGGVGAGQLVGVELLWTPQAEDDYFTRDEIISDYPMLVPL